MEAVCWGIHGENFEIGRTTPASFSCEFQFGVSTEAARRTVERLAEFPCDRLPDRHAARRSNLREKLVCSRTNVVEQTPVDSITDDSLGYRILMNRRRFLGRLETRRFGGRGRLRDDRLTTETVNDRELSLPQLRWVPGDPALLHIRLHSLL